MRKERKNVAVQEVHLVAMARNIPHSDVQSQNGKNVLI